MSVQPRSKCQFCGKGWANSRLKLLTLFYKTEEDLTAVTIVVAGRCCLVPGVRLRVDNRGNVTKETPEEQR